MLIIFAPVSPLAELISASSTQLPPRGFLASLQFSYDVITSSELAPHPGPLPPVLAQPRCSGTTLCLCRAAKDHALILEVYGKLSLAKDEPVPLGG